MVKKSTSKVLHLLLEEVVCLLEIEDNSVPLTGLTNTSSAVS